MKPMFGIESEDCLNCEPDSVEFMIYWVGEARETLEDNLLVRLLH